MIEWGVGGGKAHAKSSFARGRYNMKRANLWLTISVMEMMCWPSNILEVSLQFNICFMSNKSSNVYSSCSKMPFDICDFAST